MPPRSRTKVSKFSAKKFRERESVVATLQVLADRDLTERLLKLSKRIDADVRAGRLHTMEEVFGEK